jgi:outer membrane receptor for ferric coprogen and ferric-rhodotorulic acid
MVQLVLPVSVALPLSVAFLPAAHAEEARIPFEIPAGSLDAALSSFGRQAGVLLSVNAELTAGRTSPGVSGDYTANEALRRLLAGTGLDAVAAGDGSYTLQPSPQSSGTVMLPAVEVEGAGSASRTEGTGSYTASSTRSATGLALSPRETPQSVTVMTRSRIEDQGLDEISSVLDQTVGVTAAISTALGTDGVGYYSRGFALNNYQVDGLARPSTVYGFAETTSDMAIYDRVEVVRGATGLLSGVGDPSATVNMVRKRPTADFNAYVTAQTGSWDRYRLEADAGGALSASGKVRGRVVAAYQENGSFIDRMETDKRALYGVVEVDLSPATLLTAGAEYQHFHNAHAPRGGVPVFFSDGTETDFSRSTNVAAEWSDFSPENLNLFSSLEHRFDNDWKVNLALENMRRSYDDTIGYMWTFNGLNPDGSGGDLLAARWSADLRQQIVDLRANGPFQLFGREHELMVGINRSTSTDEGDDYPGWWYGFGSDYWYTLPDAFAFFASGDVAKPDLSATEASGGPKVTTTLTKDSGVITPYAGVVQDLTENFSAYASYTQIFSPQSNKNAGGDRLDPVEGVNYEIGVKASFYDGWLNASAAIFRIEQDNFAVAIPGVFTPDGDQAYRAADGTVSKGFEMEVAGELSPGWQIGGGFSRAEARDRDGARLLTEIPKDTVKLFSGYRLPGRLNAVTVGGNLRWQGEAYLENTGPNGETFRQGSLVTVDLMAKYDVTEHLLLSLNIDNLFDEKYFSSVGNSSFYAEPRNALLSARYSF